VNDQPMSIREANAVLLKFGQTSEKLANAAIRWALAEKHKRECKSRFSDAMSKLTHWDPSSENMGNLVFARVREFEDGVPYELVFAWNQWAAKINPEFIEGDECSGPLFDAQRVAWNAYRDAKKQAGIARGALTRMALRAAT